jgi:hypothetical protein
MKKTSVSIMVARRGKSLVNVTTIEVPDPAKVRRPGFMKRQGPVPDDFDRMGSFDIE